MIQTSFETRVKIQEIVENQLPEFILEENPKASEFLKQYYISQEFQGGPVDIVENLDQYLKLDLLTPEVISRETYLTSDVTDSSNVISVNSTKGYPNKYGLVKIDDEIITYTGITTNSFTGCVRGFSGITTYHQSNNPGELIFTSTNKSFHTSKTTVVNLSSLFLKEFYKKIKYTLTPGLEDYDFVSDLNVSNFIKEAKSFYQAKGTDESFRILFNILYGVDPKIVNLEEFLLKPSSAEFLRREIILAELISGENPFALVGQTIRKSTDYNTQASVSSVEIVSRSAKSYYKISLFIGYGDNESIEGTFTIPGKTKVVENVSVGSSIITVDSTIGFEKSGNLICNGKTIAYTNKTINQFLDCKENNGPGLRTAISAASDIRSDEVIYGYENGDNNKKVEFRITGVLNKFTPKSDIYSVVEGEKVYVKNLGEKILNPEIKNYKEFFANSWIYNTSSRYQIDSINGATFTLLSAIDKSSLAVGDKIEILKRNTNEVVFNNAIVSNINTSLNQINLNNLTGFQPNPLLKYDLRRKIKKATSANVPLLYGNDNITCDIQNLYNENDNYFYVSSNSLPSYQITTIKKEILLPDASGTAIQGFNNDSLKYSIISFNQSVPFITGDEIYYNPQSQSIPGLERGRYYVEVLSNKNQIRIYASRAFIFSKNYLEFSSLPSGSGSHLFTLFEQANKVIGPKKVLKKFSSKANITNGKGEETTPGTTGMLINGVEILNYKSNNKIYYGPISSVAIFSKGSGYDVVNPPSIEISSSIGSTALIQPVVRGELVEIIVDPQDFDINSVVSATIDGGNSSQVTLEPFVEEVFREVSFSGKLTIFGGGVDPDSETITFLTNHNFTNGQAVIYDNNEHKSIGINTFYGNNTDSNNYLKSGTLYFVKNINNRTVRLYETFSDYSLGINTVGFSTINTQGIHKFRVAEGKTTLKTIKVTNPGTGFENRKLIVKSENINLTNFSIEFKNHGFNHGDVISYEYVDSPIVGLSNTTKYNVFKLTNDSFRLCDAGSNGSNRENFLNENYVKILSSGSGYQIFKYPDIKVNLNIDYASGISGIITATPIIKGQIIDAYLYENGSDYGSSILDFHKKPNVVIKTGKFAQVKPIISNGRIINYEIQNAGTGYDSDPDLVVTGDGMGAKLRPIIKEGSLKDIIIINPGINYSPNLTTIQVVPRGSGASLDATVRSLTVNNFARYGNEYLFAEKVSDDLEYTWVGYTTSIANTIFGDNNLFHSPLIGWAYDGNPIYGPYGYSDPENSNSPIKKLKSGYELSVNDISNRPSSYDPGFFIEDYKFKNSGDLDVNNGRFCKTPDFPQGIYAYFVSVRDDNITNQLKPYFPYFIGNTYRSNSLPENKFLNQSFDFNSSSLIRNTFPYKLYDAYAGNDFLVESNELTNQFSIVESTMIGKVDEIIVKEPGFDYKINDNVIFDNEGTGGGGLSAYVSQIKGKKIDNIKTTIESYDGVILNKQSKVEILVSTGSTHNFKTKDVINLSTLSSDIVGLTREHEIFVPSGVTYVAEEIPPNVNVGFVTDIYVTDIPNILSVGNVLGIGTELMTVLNVFSQNRVLRVKRGISGTAHTLTDLISLIPNSFYIKKETPFFDSKLDDKIFFNSHQSIGVGTTANFSNSVSYFIGKDSKTISIPTQSIYLPNHSFTTNQLVTIKKSPFAYPITVSTTPSGTIFNILDIDNQQDFYVINKSKDYIGIVTNVGLTTSTNGLYFRDNGSNDYEYSIESNYSQITGKVEKISSQITLKENHNLQEGDTINLEVLPNQTVGIGTTLSLKLYYNSNYDKIIVNPIEFSSSGINTTKNSITINSHGFKTGDKVFYYSQSSTSVGLSTGGYFVYRISDNEFRLCETYNKVISPTPKFVNIVSVGGTSHYIGLINPSISVRKNNNLIFKLSDSSLYGYNLKIFYDKDFKNEFISIENSSEFLISKSNGIVGLSTQNATLTLKYSDLLPSKLFYSLEKSGFISTSDIDVQHGSEIVFKNSEYTGKYSITGIGSTSFNINLRNKPEELFYNSSSVAQFTYTTDSLKDQGPIEKVKVNFGGDNYKKLPIFKEIISENGKNAFLLASSKNIGKLDSIRVFDPGFEYSTDKTLRPEAYISPVITLQNATEVLTVNIIDGGKNYTSPPDFALVHPITRSVASNGLIECDVVSSSVGNIKITQPPKGLDSLSYELYTINNSNGIPIESIESAEYSGIVTCYLTTPVFGFTNPPFATGNKIFVEGIQKNVGSSGKGFNSTDYGYQFFEITSYINSNPAKLEYQLPNGESNPGVAKTFQNSYATIINKNSYPQFIVEQTFSKFLTGEQLLVLTKEKFVLKNIFITDFRGEYIKIYGIDSLKVGDIIQGKNSGSLAEIRSVVDNKGLFEVNYSLRKDYGWLTDVGKLNLDYQVTPNNDYYQNLSYTVKSPISFEDLKTPVNSLLHTSGLKNFADTEILSNAKTSIGSSIVTFTNVIDLINEERVDTLNNFDTVLDVDVVGNVSKFVKFNQKKLTDYIECQTNRVLRLDDVSSTFSNKENSNTNYVDIVVFATKDDYSRVLVQIIDPDRLDIETAEVFIFKDSNNIFTFQKQYLTNTSDSKEFGNLYGNLESDGRATLRFSPYDFLKKDYDIKVLRSQFNTSQPGIGTKSLGNISLTGINTYVGIGTTTSSIIKVGINSISSLIANIQVINMITGENNFAEIYLTHDGNDTYKSEYYMDADEANGTYSSNFIGTFSSIIESGVLKLNYTTPLKPTLVKAEIIGFGQTSLGISTYTFTSSRQSSSSARTARLFSTYSEQIGISSIFSLASNLFTTVKSYIKVGIGSTSSLHQLLLINDGNNVVTSQYPYLAVRNINGIGTFGGVHLGSNFALNFYPDSEYSSEELSIQSYNEAIFTFSDGVNVPVKFDFGTVSQSLSLSLYNALDGLRINRKSFNVTSEGIPIFAKSFDPEDLTFLNRETGVFTIQDHFFSTAERLIYTPKSTYIGVSSSPMGIGATLNSSGIVTTILPTEVYAIKIDNDNFQLSTRRDYALLGIAVTFTSSGSGNAHQLEMYKKLEKSIISIDGVIQSPMAYTPINYQLVNNGGSIGVGRSYFVLSGISSIYPDDVIKVDNEFMKVNSVGLGTINIGPITGIGTFNLVYVERGVLGTVETIHNDSSTARLYSGSYNIVGNILHFISAPRGDSANRKNESNLSDPRSTFGGRVFLQNDYSSNVIFDDISRTFDGLKEIYSVTVQGINTTGIQTGNGLLLINNVFQTPTTDNNPNNNYTYKQVSGITSVVFSGITSSNGSIIKSLYDVNQNQLPRGGILVSLGSSTGMGYAPLVGAAVTAVVGAGGSIKAVGISTFDIYGSGYRESVAVGITESGHVGTAASIIATVGVGGSLSFTVINGGSGYINPTIQIRPPDYQNLSITGVYRRGIGQTTDCGNGLLMNIEIGSSETELQPVSGKHYDASSLILANKQLIAEVAVGRMLDNYPAFSVPGGSQNCIADIISVLECLAFNLRYGGNERVYDAAKLYVDNNYLLGEEEQSIYAFMQAKDMAVQAMRNETITIGGYSTLNQYFDNTIIGDISGVPGVYNSGDCSDIASAIDSFVGIVTFSIRDNTVPASRVAVTTSYFEVTGFNITRSGYGFQIGDIFKPVGLVTDGRLSSPIQEFTLTVLDVFNDGFSSWSFGELDYIDSVKELQDGTRTRFPLFYDGNLLSFEKNNQNLNSERIDLSSILLIMVNGVIQEPYVNYIFSGGTSFSFTTAPRPEDRVSIFFYRGKRGVDSVTISNILTLLKVGDNIKINRNNNYPSTIPQNNRTIHRITSSDKVETNTYVGPGIDEVIYKPVNLIKQKVDKLIAGEYFYKTRPILESLIFPTSKIIKNVQEGDTEIFVDDAQFFEYEEDNSSFVITNLGGLIVNDKNSFAGKITATVSSNGLVDNLVVENNGNGYIGTSINVGIAAPPHIGVGIGTTATAVVSIVNNQLSSPLIINAGYGYSSLYPPNVIVKAPAPIFENISNITGIEGFTGIITGISTSTGTAGNSLALKFFMRTTEIDFNGLNVGYPILIYDTTVGNGITSIDISDNSIVGIGTSFLDNIYYIHNISSFGNNAVITTNIQSNSNIVGIATTGSINKPLGKFSWGRFYGFVRGNKPLSIGVTGFTVNSGLSSFPTIQRRGYGIRDSGALKEQLL